MTLQEPLIIFGTFTGADSSYFLKAWNKTQDTSCTGDLGSDGKYLIDLANCGYAVDDVVFINILKGVKSRTEQITITQIMIDEGSYDQGTKVLYYLPEHIYSVVYNLINDNKPAAFTDIDNTTEVTWTLLSAYPEKEPTFPCIVLNPANVSYSGITMDNSQSNDKVSVDIEYYSKVKWKKKRIDNGRGHMLFVIREYIKDLEFSGLYLDQPNYLEDSNIDSFDSGDEQLNTATNVLKLRWTA